MTVPSAHMSKQTCLNFAIFALDRRKGYSALDV